MSSLVLLREAGPGCGVAPTQPPALPAAALLVGETWEALRREGLGATFPQATPWAVCRATLTLTLILDDGLNWPVTCPLAPS